MSKQVSLWLARRTAARKAGWAPRFVLVALAGTACATVPTAEDGTDGRTVVAVVGSLDRDRLLRPREVENLESYLGTRLSQSPRFRVSSQQGTLNEVRRQKRIPYHSEHYDEASLVEIGKELAAKKVLSVRVGRLGTKCSVELKLLDLETATSDDGRARRVQCNRDYIIDVADRALVELVEDIPATPKKGSRGGISTTKAFAWTSIGLAALSAAASAVFVNQAESQRNAAQDAADVGTLTTAVDDGELMQTLGFATGGAAAGLLVLGLVLYFVDAADSQGSAVVLPLQDGVVVGLGGSF